jgi:hypothetical protein
LVGPSVVSTKRKRGVEHFLQLAIPSRTSRRVEHRERWRVRMRSAVASASNARNRRCDEKRVDLKVSVL